MRLKQKIAFQYLFLAFIIFVSFSFAPMNSEQNPILKIPQFLNKKITDGPFFFIQDDNTVIVKWIKGKKAVEKEIKNNNYKKIQKKTGLAVNSNFFNFEEKKNIDLKQEYKDVEKFIALSDIHGQFDLFVTLLLQYDVVDQDLNWKYGSNHLIINGDVFDRGDQVTEIFWLIYILEKQAEKQGGKVHFLLGNHEVMVLNKDFRYVNDKYFHTTQLLNTPYDQLYSENTVIGNWLRSKPVIFSINDILFTHAGISPEFVEREITVEQANEKFLNNKYNASKDSLLLFLEKTNGIVWYRGYFKTETFNEQKLDKILSYFNKNYIVVGHTTMPNVMSLYSGKLICVDSGIKNGEYGEVLVYENGEFFRGTPFGSKIKLLTYDL
jgi:Calcineurin-like phosphoesterase